MFKFLKILTVSIPIGAIAMQTQADTVDTTHFAALTAVEVTGKGSRTIIVTDPARAPGVTIRDDQAGGLLCSLTADVSQRDGVLSVDIRNRGLSLGIGCDITVELVIPRPVAVTVAQPQAVIELNGTFTEVTIDVSKMTVTFDGQADTFDVNGDMAVVDAVFARARDAAPQIDIDVSKLVADVGYANGAGLDYSVSAPVAMFSRRHPQTPGATGRMRITSDVSQGVDLFRSRAELTCALRGEGVACTLGTQAGAKAELPASCRKIPRAISPIQTRVAPTTELPA